MTVILPRTLRVRRTPRTRTRRKERAVLCPTDLSQATHAGL